MANGQRRAKLKKVLSPTSSGSSHPAEPPGDDDGLLDDLLTELDSRSPVVQQEAATVINEMQAHQDPSSSSLITDSSETSAKKSSKQRFKEREQRKTQAVLDAAPKPDPEADARLEREAKLEERSIKDTCSSLGLQMIEIPPDGHCLFSAIADQLASLGIIDTSTANYKTTRTAAADFMWSHPDDFLPFLPSIAGEDGAGSTEDGMMTPEGFKQYCKTIRDTGLWGGEPEITALSRAYNVSIHVVQTGPPPVVEHSPMSGSNVSSKIPTAFISYHRRMYGLGEHYNSLRPKGSIASRIIDKVGL